MLYIPDMFSRITYIYREREFAKLQTAYEVKTWIKEWQLGKNTSLCQINFCVRAHLLQILLQKYQPAFVHFTHTRNWENPITQTWDYANLRKAEKKAKWAGYQKMAGSIPWCKTTTARKNFPLCVTMHVWSVFAGSVEVGGWRWWMAFWVSGSDLVWSGLVLGKRVLVRAEVGPAESWNQHARNLHEPTHMKS